MARSLCSAAQMQPRGLGIPAIFAASFGDAIERVTAAARSGDMILTLGAGSVSQLGPQILERLEARSGQAISATESR